MNPSTSRHRWYRFGAIMLFLLLFAQAMVIFYSFFSTPTDENIFRTAPTRIMAVKNVPGVMTSRKPYFGGAKKASEVKTDSLMTGDLILAINNGEVRTMKDALQAMEDYHSPEIRFDVVRPSANVQMTFVVKREHVPEGLLALLSSYVYVTDVVPGGASDRAGMKQGDLILRINEQEFGDAFEADRILRLGQIGKSLKYEILRNNTFIVLHVVLAKFGIGIALLVFTVSGLLWMFAGLFIAASRPNLLAARLLGFAFILLGFFLATLVIRRDFFITPEVLLRQIIIGGSYIIGVALMFHAFHYFPVERTDLLSKPWIGRGYYLSSAAAAALNLLTGSGLPILLPVFYGAFIMLRYRKGATQEYQRYNAVIKWTGMVCGVLCLGIILVFNNSLQTVGLGLVGVILLLIPMSYLYTIARYRLLDINFRVRRNTQYSIATVVWGIAVFYALVWAFFRLPSIDLPQTTIVFTGTAIEITDDPEMAGQRGTSERIMLMSMAIILTFVVLKLRSAGQRFIDKKYYRQQYDYRRASFELGEVLATTLSAEELAKGLVQKLSELMKLKRTGVLFFRDERCCSCHSAHGFDGDRWEQFCVAHDAELIAAIRQFNNEFRIDYLPPLLKEAFQKEGFQFGIPIRSKERLIGVLLVGEKQSETTFRQEDLAFLASTSKQASVAIENAFLYEELAEKERMKHELQIARRIQIDSLPQNTPTVLGLDIAGTSVPAMEVGGDFFDYLSNGNGRITVVIGDVSGKGTSAALYMSKVQGILRSLHGFELPPKELFRRANTLLCQDLEKRSFVTVLGAEFDTAQRSITVSRAGHLPLWHYQASENSVQKILPRGLGLGLNDASIFTSEMEELRLSYRIGDVFLFATDGVIEAHDAHGDFGEERLLHLLRTHHHASAKEIQTAVLQDLAAFVGEREQHDDQTLVIVKAV